ncbi:MAG: histidine ammonia-lyase [Actinomycetota bacterium]|nr:histidine ammonia-lyase [Actinomycetota bacterium]
MMALTIRPGELTLAELRAVHEAPVTISVDWPAAVDASVATVRRVVDEDRTVYGINTGFGLLAQTRIAHDDLALLQRSLVLSHCTGVGDPLPDELVRLILVLKVNALARGYSGIRREIVEMLVALVNAEVYPVVPAAGSVGASGDLAPLAHVAAVLLGEGTVRHGGAVVPASDGLARAGLGVIDLGPKEGLALLNGTQASTAYALRGLFAAEDLFAAGIVAGALTVEAMRGSRLPFDERIHAVRGHAGQIDAAAALRHLLGERSEISDSHADCDKVQDPYSVRCQPQVMGACLTQIRDAASVLHVEANAVSDNPLVFADDDEVLSGGNFHAEPVAMAADNLALAIAEIGSISERRVALMMDSSMSRLPHFLVPNGGVNSGFMIAQVTAAAMSSENKSLAHPRSVDTVPTSANQEDHVSMAPAAGMRLWAMTANTGVILGVEWLAACQGIDFHEGLSSTPALEEIRRRVREVVAFYDRDRFFKPDLDAGVELVASRPGVELLPDGLLPSRAAP